MAITRVINGSTYHIKSNRIPRPLFAAVDLPPVERKLYFDYIDEQDAYSPRLFNYRGAWYDYYEFERAQDDVNAMGFDGIQTESYFSAVVVSYFERDGYELDGEIIVGYIHW